MAAEEPGPVPLGWVVLFVLLALGLTAAVIAFVGGSPVGGTP